MRYYLLLTLCVITVHAIELETLYGTFDVTEPIINELLASDGMQRLKHISQHGITDIIMPEYAFDRYDHSVGVFVLVRLYGGSLEEQVAAILHDASHTVFSHVGDLIFNSTDGLAYQDYIHEWYLQQTDIFTILQRYNMWWAITDTAKDTFKLLEQPYPDICADRLEYQLRTGYLTKMLTLEDIAHILQHLHFDTQWYFDDVVQARKLADVSMNLTQQIYNTPDNTCLYKYASDALKRGLEIGIISNDDIHFSYDAIIWNKIQNSNDDELIHILHQIDTYKTSCLIGNRTHNNYHKISKFRVIDPLVNGDRLSFVDEDFEKNYHEALTECNYGAYFIF